uniref:Uncharacterized protein n=1 Tax=Tanacetum cinerariifolium TaxID=118510 RepID=A0A699IWM1_TANCI|nr:hypothetical protein [Tanacetum cinerariifolium]
MNKKAKEESSDKGVDSTKKRKAGSRMKMMSIRKKTDRGVTAGPTTTPTTTTIFDDEEMTLADTLIKLKDDKAKDKDKGVLEEPDFAKKMTKSDFDPAQIAKDEEIARQLEVELQAEGLYTKEQELITDFVPIGSKEDERRIRDMNKKAEEESSDKGVDSTKKRKAGSRMKMMSIRQKTDVDLEEEEKLNFFLKIDPDEEGIIDYEFMDKRFPIIN